MKYLSIACLLFFVACNQEDQKESPENKTANIDSIEVKLQLVTDVLNAPVQMEATADGQRLYFADITGKIWIWKNDSLQSKTFLDISNRLEQKDTAPETRAMFSMAFHPQYATNRKFYVCYNAPTSIKENICKLAISEFTADANNPDIADANTEHRIFETESKTIEKNADGMAFGPDGYLYISIGDHDDSAYDNHGQNMNDYSGKMLRIDVNKTPYAVPADNPFVGVKDTKPEIWASGLRRSWRFSFDPKTKQLFAGDVGESKVEEINIIQKGGNYGWPVKEGDSVHYTNVAMNSSPYIPPIYTYTHKEGICVIGGNFYYGDSLPGLKNKYVFADFNGGIFALTKNADGKWTKQTLKILNKPADPFLICGLNQGANNELYVMGLLNTKTGFKGVVYKIVKG